MKRLIEKAKKASIWLSTIIIILVSIVFFISIPFQYDLIEEESTKKVYYVDNISDAHKIIIDKFNIEYKNEIEIVPVNLPFSKFTTNDRKAILTRSLRNRSDGIDIFAVDLIWIPRFAKWSYPLENDIDETIISKFNDVALEACYQNDNLLAFPVFFDIGVLYYRKDLINKLEDGAEIEKKIKRSLEWNEFIELGNRFKNTKNPFYLFPGGSFEGMMCNFHEMLSWEQSENIFNNIPHNVNVEYSRKALQQMVDFIHKYNFSPAEVVNYDGFSAYVNGYNNDAVFLRGWIGFPKHYKYYLNDTTKIKYMEIAPLPHFKGMKTSSVFGGWNLMVSKFSERKKEALTFIKYLFKKENQIILYEKGGYLPVNTEVYLDSTFIAKNKELQNIMEIIKWSKHRPFLDNYTTMSEILAKNFHKALKLELSVPEALDRANKEINMEKGLN